MRPPAEPSSPNFSSFEPTILDSEMDNTFSKGDLHSFDPAVLDSPTSDELDEMFIQPNAEQVAGSTSCLSPSELTLKKATNAAEPPSYTSDTQSASPAESTHASSTDSSVGHMRNTSINSNHSEIFSPGSVGTGQFLSNGWSSAEGFSTQHDFFGQDNGSSFLKTDFATDGDLEMSNKAMDSAFDFDSAASSPSLLKMETGPETNGKSPSAQPSLPANAPRPPDGPTNSPQSFGFATSPFVFQGSPSSFPPEQGHTGPNFWEGPAPPAVEQQGQKPEVATAGTRSALHSTLSPSLDLGMQTQHYPTAPPSANGHIATNLHPNAHPTLVVHPTSLKSRVETQIPIKLTLHPMPFGVKKLRLPSHAISKPKFLAKSADVDRAPEILELKVSVVCTSAMQDQGKRDRAFARARGDISNKSSSDDASNEEETPLDGAEVKICTGCIQRERKRASRKKQRKPEEDELFQKDEDKRIVVFNTTELKDWVDPPKSVLSDPAAFPIPQGAMQVDLPMRIACYCRHQNEKQGFQVIFTVKDHLENVLAQTITNPIMITDDHKTHPSANAAAAAAAAAASGAPDNKRPSVGVFAANTKADMFINQPPFKLSHSATDLQALRNQQYGAKPNSNTPAHDASSGSTNGTTSRSLSRQASPNDMPGPSAKRRKQSGAGKVPTNLAMTKIEAPRATDNFATNTSSTFGSPLTRNARSMNGQPDLPYVMPSSQSPQFANGPPTPGNHDTAFFNQPDRAPPPQPPPHDNSALSSLISAPPSAQPSRPSTPGGSRSTFQDQNVGPQGTAGMTNQQTWNVPLNLPHRLPTMIHKLVPAEGSTTGGNEVTVLGSGFAPGMEVVFGDTLATTTTFWGDKCLNCLTPPAMQEGTVPVLFKHEHPRFGGQQGLPMMPKQQNLYRYVDDRELQMYRVALGILGQKLRNPADAFQTAQQIMGSDPNMLWNYNNYQGGSGQTQHGNGNSQNNNNASDLDARMLVYLEFMDLDDSPRSPKFNSRSATGHTLLHLASSLGLTRFAAGLLARRADPNVPDNNGNTPMHLAALSGHNHIVHRLRLSGARAAVENTRGFTAADLATTLPAHQAVLVPAHHYRSRSADSTRSPRRQLSSSSLDMFWETSSAVDVDDSTSSSDEVGDEDMNMHPPSRRTSVDQSTFYISHSREPSVPPPGIPQSNEAVPPDVEVDRSFSPPAALVAWRDQLATQINQFQHNVNRAFPNLPALPPMPALPDYQTHPMMQRITSLVPQRPTTAWSTSIMRDGWDRLTGNSAPPAYEELYPINESDEDQEVKKASMVQAAADAALEQHFETQPERPPSSFESVKEEIGDVRIGRKNISRQQQEQLRKAHARKMKKIRSDRNLFFIWIPLLLLIIIAMSRNFMPEVWQGASQGYQFVKSRYLTQDEDTRIPT